MTCIEVEPDYETLAACSMGDCGDVNYRLLGYYGARARWAKAWGVTEDEAADRMARRDIEERIKTGELIGPVEDYL